MTYFERRATITLAAFCGLTAIGCATELITWRHGNRFVPAWLLDDTPFDDFLVPGMLLLFVGIACILAALATWRGHALALDARLIAGGVLTGWVVAQLAILREVSFLHALYLALGLALLVPALRSAWSSGVRRRFTGLTALGAATVWTMVAAIMVAASATDPSPAVVAIITVPAGSVALVAIGAAQWLELRHHARTTRTWIGWTALAWLVALPASMLPGPLIDESTPVWSLLALYAVAGTLMAFVVATVTWQGVVRLRPR